MLEGSLKDFSLDDLLQMISLGGKQESFILKAKRLSGKKRALSILKKVK